MFKNSLIFIIVLALFSFNVYADEGYNTKALLIGKQHSITGENIFNALKMGKDNCLWTNCYANEVSLGNITDDDGNQLIQYITLPSYGTVGNTLECTVWDYNTTGQIPYNYITDDFATGSKLWVSSSSLSDEITDTGARTVHIWGLSPETYELINESINMNGRLTVETTYKYARVNRFEATSAGSTSYNLGDIYLHRSAVSSGVPSDSSKVYRTIRAKMGTSHALVYTVPEGKKMLIKACNIGAGSGKQIIAGIYSRDIDNNIWINNLPAVDYENRMQGKYEYPFVFPAKTDIEIRARTDASTVNVDASLFFLLEDTE